MHPATGLTIATSAVASGHVAIAVLQLTRRAVYSIPPSADNVIALAAGKPWWAWIHLAAGLALWVTLGLRRGQTGAGYWSVAVMGTWSALLLVWGLGAVRPVSLVGPVLGLVIAIAAIGTTTAWSDRASGNNLSHRTKRS
jgi:hypothetical protein